MRNSFFILLMSLTLFTSCTSKATTSEVAKQPNIIYILADDMGYGDVQCNNPQGKISTPNLDAMASNGVRFTDTHTSSAVCTPTRYGILTGRYNWRSPLKSSVLGGYSKSLITVERTTVADLLKMQGYTTAYIGKWHLGWDWKIMEETSDKQRNNLNAQLNIDFSAPITNGPQAHGFDYSYGFCGSLDMPPYVWVENSMPTMVPTKVTRSVDDKGFWRAGPTSDDFVHAKVLQDVTDKAVAYISQNAHADQPFFLYLPLPAPHTPILPSSEFMGKSNTNMYGDFVMQVDDVVGQIRQILKDKGISENTLLVFTSDNGCSPKANFEELTKVNHHPNGPFRGMKADIFEGGHRVPFIVEWPKGAEANKVINQTLCTTDFFATCAAVSGYMMQDNEGEDSYSFLPLVTGEAISIDRPYTVHHSIYGSFAIRKGDWKMAFCRGSGGWSDPRPNTFKNAGDDVPMFQLYNLKEDVAEITNLVNDYPEIAKELKAAMKKIILDGRSTPGAPQTNEDMDHWGQIKNIID